MHRAQQRFHHSIDRNMAFLGKIYPRYVIDAVNCTVVRFFLCDGLLTAEENLERLKFAILFTIADMSWVKKWQTHVTREYAKQ